MQPPAARSRTPAATVLVCFAMEEEAGRFRKIAAGKSGISILITGIGRRNAEKSVREFLATNSPELVLTCGFAGGLNPDLKLGEVVFELTDSELRAQLFAAGAKPAKFFCADRIATTVTEKKKLRHETGADAVEMESLAIHDVCRDHGLPCATVRVISDTADKDLPLDFNALFNADLSLNHGRLALVIAKSPGKIGALMKLQKQTKAAAEKLAEILRRITAS
jgi:adenosylhomocysteine nucleosidase